ncbi:MAG: Hsp20/alpha crystallin family protein [Patescibacteria group bacterium]
MALIKWTPFYEPFLDMERSFGEQGLASFNPAIDLYEKDNDLIAEVALAGIDPEKVKISIEDNVLDIEGSLEKKSEIDENNYYRREVRSGSFHRMISLPAAVNSEKTQAEYDKGILKITMPKKDEAHSKPIKVTIKK